MSHTMFPSVFDEFERFRQQYGPVDKLPTRVFFTGLDIAEEMDVSFDLIPLLFINAYVKYLYLSSDLDSAEGQYYGTSSPFQFS